MRVSAMIKRLSQLVLATVFACSFPGTAIATCALVSVKFEPDLTYDPFGGRGAQSRLELFVTRTGCGPGEETRPIEIWFADDRQTAAGDRMIGGVPVEIRSQGINYLGRGGAGPAGNVLQAAGAGERTLQFDVSSEPDVASAFDEQRELSVYYRASGDPGPARRVPVMMRLRLLPKFDLSVNGGRNANLNFGIIEPGEEMALLLRARGTQPFKIEMSSLYGSRMRRVKVCGEPISSHDPLEAIDVSLSIGGQFVTDRMSYRDTSVQSGKVFEQRLPFIAKIDPGFAPARKRAGDYCDVISLRVVPL